MAVPARDVVTEAEYLEFEDAQELKHELLNGEIVAMSGCSEAHATVTMYLLELLLGGLKGKPCRPLSSDFRVCIDETGLYAYPDVTVVCGPRRLTDHAPPALLNPTVLIEVLSESTESYDRGAKFEHYRRCASVQCVLFVDSRRRAVTVSTRGTAGRWTLLDCQSGAVTIDVLGVTLQLDEIYAGTEETQGWG
jgi:Uma2 family endonuclease